MKPSAQGQGSSRLLAAVALGASLAATAACAPETSSEPTEVAREQEAAQREAARREVRPSPIEVVLEAARWEADLDAEQAIELEALAEEAEAGRERFQALHEELRAASATVVRAGSADSEDFERAIGEGVAAVESQVRESLDTLEQIHALLEPDQRAAVADALRAEVEERMERRAQRREERRRDGASRLAEYLVLSPSQLDELRALQKEWLGERKELRPRPEELFALIDAFEGEDFGAALDDAFEAKRRVLRVRVGRASERADTALSILTPAQRGLLADLILEGPTKLLLGDAAEARRDGE